MGSADLKLCATGLFSSVSSFQATKSYFAAKFQAYVIYRHSHPGIPNSAYLCVLYYRVLTLLFCRFIACAAQGEVTI